MRAYQFAATRLALVRDGLDRGLYRRPSDVDRAVAEERGLLAAITAQREQFVGRDPLTPWAWWDGTGYQVQFPDGAVRAVGSPPLPVLPLPFVLPPPVANYGQPGYGQAGYR